MIFQFLWKILHIQKWNIPLNEFFQNTEIENFYTIILKSAAGRIEPLSGRTGPRAVVCSSVP